ncbi:MAG: EamA family transporter [Chloroflexi bacterium HGW-Chloroflexi-3]|nr:MAG: EamA family transporter [Chloroflexi bacterium HGW-Chloroflexi-3]
MSKDKLYPLFGLFFGILAVSTASIFIRFAQSGAPSIVIAAVRLLIASLLITPIAFLQYTQQLFSISKRELYFLLLSGLFLSIHFAAWISSLEYTSIASSVVLVTTTPLWVALFSPILLKEKNSATIWIGLFLALVGSSLVALSNQCSFSFANLIQCESVGLGFDRNTLSGNFLALLGAWMAAGYMMVGRKVRSTLPLIKYIFFVYLFSAIFLLFIVVISGETLVGYSKQAYLWMLLLGLIPQLLGHSIFNWALGHLPAAFVSIALIGEPIGTILLAFLFLQETPNNLEYFGGLLILIGIFFVSFLTSKKT